MADWRPAVGADDIWEGAIHKASVEGLSLILLSAEGKVRAYEDRCPHEGHPLSEGELEADVLICAKHLWEFDVATGKRISRVHRPECNLKAYPVRIVEGMIEVDISAGGTENRAP